MNQKKKTIIYTSLIIVFLIFTFLAPYLFSKGYSGIVFNADTGAIGDTIGGITAPFINLLAAFLVWISFREQVKANKMLSSETSYNFTKALINDLRSTFDITQKNTFNVYVTNMTDSKFDKILFSTLPSGKKSISVPDETFSSEDLFNIKTELFIVPFHLKYLSKSTTAVINNIDESNLNNSIKNTLLNLIDEEVNF